MTFNGVSGSDKAPLRFIYMQSGILVAIWLLSFFTEVSGEVVAPLEQGFFFDWTPGGARLPTPITAQCESINIKWGRGNATGRTPIAPFSLAIYLSTATVPVVVPAPGNPVFELDLPIPFEPLTQYQICMYDTNGVSGGCQSTYTVYPSPNATSVGSSHCPNITIPAKSLDVVASTVADGPLSPFGWINQCSDISFTPTSGTPPYTLTIAPSSRPPFNVTLMTARRITGHYHWDMARNSSYRWSTPRVWDGLMDHYTVVFMVLPTACPLWVLAQVIPSP
ncbi:hypothetical protein QCA50_001424 [Cerrena zonata]|uniref:Uncharacterized protein n=1 Tax=Cerrena zonata TaxID=2478898 RepID=A0AAW0GQY7_9APHY